MKDGFQVLTKHPHEHLVIYPMLDRIISAPSVAMLTEALGERANIVSIPTGTHSVLYDKDPDAEHAAVDAIVAFAKDLQNRPDASEADAE